MIDFADLVWFLRLIPKATARRLDWAKWLPRVLSQTTPRFCETGFQVPSAMELNLGELNLLLHFHSLGVLPPPRVKMAEKTTPHRDLFPHYS